MHIIQITDLHIGPAGVDTFGIDVRANCQQLLAAVANRRPDLLVVTGDLSFQRGDQEVYAWVKVQLDELRLPYEVIGGNHDSSSMLAAAFGYADELHGEYLYYRRDWFGRSFLFLDTAVGEVFAEQRQWLQEQLASIGGPLTIFMHHPPIPAGVPFMDLNHALRAADSLRACLSAHPYPIDFFCGHYHVDKTLHWGQHVVHLTPSGFFQINQMEPTFAVDHYRVGLRHLEWTDYGLQSTVVYGEGARLGGS